MIEEYEKQRRKQVAGMRSILDYGMGVLFIIIGGYFLLYEALDMNIFRQKPSAIDKFAGVLFLIYGLWRIYRGYKKNYFR
ncbi:hypothetical protein SAMN05444008_103244 [Cnuella takakiae]|uniref:Uncharacterized protein n=1 Tax=Cnuella takakiae TaxID=1302690 RepID=A0A1M4X4D3_9BACT|nr:hypothetical protein [Cnuella takakiae]OLY91538.1 hypothetical protein BUE76_06185 [Cnuella takakiae]SHE88348.1 hypothetical protein SAMN05444008_103244 [Cnuella takakiae]